LVDLWRLFGERNNVKISFALADWADSLDQVQSGIVNVHGGLTVSENREAFLDFSEEILRIRTLLFLPMGSEKTDLADLTHETVGVIDGTFDQDFVNMHFPEVNLVTFPNSEVMVEAAIQGKIHAFVADYPVGYYRLLVADSIDRFRATSTLYTESIHAAVARDNSELIAFINTGLAKITKAERTALSERWLIPPSPRPDWVMPALFGGIGGVLVLAFFGHYWALRRLVRIRTRELEDARINAERLASTDALTGIGSRRAFYAQAAKELARATRYRRPLCVVLFDLDNLKAINDGQGHAAGDKALKKLVDSVSAGLRSSDFFARLGGDEFAALLPETSGKEAVTLIERIQQGLTTAQPGDFPADETSHITFSAGVAEFEEDISIDDWLKRADARLYKGKAAGKARVVGA
jgi:diguanylate cyclase (GGDEF)-like protein